MKAIETATVTARASFSLGGACSKHLDMSRNEELGGRLGRTRGGERGAKGADRGGQARGGRHVKDAVVGWAAGTGCATMRKPRAMRTWFVSVYPDSTSSDRAFLSRSLSPWDAGPPPGALSVPFPPP